MVRNVWLVSTLAALLGCSAGTDDGGTPGVGSAGPPCTLTVSGATSGSYACSARAAGWSDTTDVGSVMMGYGTTGQTIPAIGVYFTFSGMPPYPGTFTDADADGGVSARLTVTAGASSWAATVGTRAPTNGTYTLVLTNVITTKVLDDAEIYAIAGTLDATLPAVQGTSATGDVSLHGAF